MGDEGQGQIQTTVRAFDAQAAAVVGWLGGEGGRRQAVTSCGCPPPPFCGLQSGKEIRKIADRDRKAAEKAAQMKAAALRDDDNVFDVSYEQQGDGDGTLSATDIKVGGRSEGRAAAAAAGAGGRVQRGDEDSVGAAHSMAICADSRPACLCRCTT